MRQPSYLSQDTVDRRMEREEERDMGVESEGERRETVVEDLTHSGCISRLRPTLERKLIASNPLPPELDMNGFKSFAIRLGVEVSQSRQIPRACRT